jgi:hypothetical protein
MVIPAELDGGEDLRDRETVELVRKVREMVLVVPVVLVLVLVVTKRMGSGIPVIPSAGRGEMVGEGRTPLKACVVVVVEGGAKLLPWA